MPRVKKIPDLPSNVLKSFVCIWIAKLVAFFNKTTKIWLFTQNKNAIIFWIIAFCVCLIIQLRRVRDSNPRTCYSQQFSRLPQSTALPTLRLQNNSLESVLPKKEWNWAKDAWKLLAQMMHKSMQMGISLILWLFSINEIIFFSTFLS